MKTFLNRQKIEERQLCAFTVHEGSATQIDRALGISGPLTAVMSNLEFLDLLYY